MATDIFRIQMPFTLIIHSFNQTIYWAPTVPQAVLSAGNTQKNKSNTGPCAHGASKEDKPYINKYKNYLIVILLMAQIKLKKNPWSQREFH